MSIVLSDGYVITSYIDPVSLSGILRGGSDDAVLRIVCGGFCLAEGCETKGEMGGAFFCVGGKGVKLREVSLC